MWNSCWASWAARARRVRNSIRGSSRRYSEVHVRYGAKREIVFHPGTECPTAFSARRNASVSTPTAAECERTPMANSRDFSSRPPRSGTICAATTMRSALIAQIRDRAALGPKRSKNLPTRHPKARVQQAAERAALSVSTRRDVVSSQGRPLLACRRHGPGQDDPSHRRRGNPPSHHWASSEY